MLLPLLLDHINNVNHKFEDYIITFPNAFLGRNTFVHHFNTYLFDSSGDKLVYYDSII